MPHHSDIGISTGAYLKLSLGAALLRIAELAPAAEIFSLGHHSLLERVNARAIEASGLPFSVHGPFTHRELGNRSKTIRHAAVELHRAHMEVAAELGSHLYIVHPDLKPRWRMWDPRVADALQRSFAELYELQERIGIPVAVENMPLSSHSHFTAPGDLDLQGLGLALDVGHAALTGTLADWLAHTHTPLVHVHLHDNQGENAGDHHQALGSGVVDAAEVLAVARAAGATIVLEHPDDESVLSSLEHLHERGLLPHVRG